MLAAYLVFWISLGALGYILIGHALLLAILAAIRARPVRRAPVTPGVCFILPALNEERDIGAKLDSIDRLDYPRDRVRVVVVSDASTDGTDAIVRDRARRDPRIELIRQSVRAGRTAAINRALARCRPDVYVLSDANVLLAPGALRALVASFADPRVGAVAGRLAGPVAGGNPSESGLGRYWNYEQSLRVLESRIGSTPFVPGCLTAVRGDLLPPIPDDCCSDHLLPAILAARGFRSVYEPAAVVYEQPANTIWQEARIRGRNVLAGMNALRRIPATISFRRHPWFLLNLGVRKVARWFSPVLLLASLVAALVLVRDPAPRILLALTVLGIAATILSLTLRRPPRLLGAIGFLALAQFGLLLGLVQYLFGRRIVFWDPSR